MLTAIKEAFSGIGLSEKESSIMGFLLQTGPALAARIAEKTGLNRTTVYALLNSLRDRGLVSTVKKRGVTRFQSIDPKLLPDYLARKRDELVRKEEALKEILPQIMLRREKSISLPKVQFFEGESGVKQAYEDTLENNKQKVLYDLTGVDAVMKRMGAKWLDYYLEKRVRLGIRCVNIAPDSAWARESKRDDDTYKRVTKLMPARFSFETEIAVYDDKVGIFSFAKDSPVAVLIEDSAIARSLKAVFDYIDWTL